MGTCNFYSKNTDFIYSIDQPMGDPFFYDDLLMDLKESFKSIGYDSMDKYDLSKSHSGRMFAENMHELIIPISYDGIDDEIIVYLTFRPLIRSGYYSGFNLDLEYSIEYFHSHGHSDDIDDIDDYLIDEIRNFMAHHFDDHYIWDDVDRIRMTSTGWVNRVDEWIENEFNEWINDSADVINNRFNQIKKDIESIFAEYSDDELIHVGTFSNGNGVYQRRQANG